MENFIKTPFASIGDRDAIPDPIQSTGDVSMTTGYGFDYERDQTSDINAKNIERQKMNWLFYVITQALNEYQSLGVPDFITSALNGGAAYSYKKSAMVRYDGTIYISLVDNNEALPTDNTKWSELIMSNSTSFDGYLKTENLLSEIKDKGTASQKKSQENIGIEGDIAYRDKENKFTEPNTFDNYLISNLALRICAPNDKKLICDISGAYVDLAYKTTFARIRSVSGNLVGGAYHFLVNSPDELILEDTSKKKQYVTYNTGNLTPVLSVNKNKPDANGNVTVSTGSASAVLGVRFSAEIAIKIGNDGVTSTALHASAGGAVAALGDRDTSIYPCLDTIDSAAEKLLQVNINGTWSTAGQLNATQLLMAAKINPPSGPVSLFKNLREYTGETYPAGVDLIDDDGIDWRSNLDNVTGTVFVAYDAGGVIKQISNDDGVSSLTPSGLSVACLDALPVGCDIRGSWIFDESTHTVIQDAAIAENQTLIQNTSKQTQLIASANNEVAMLNACASAGRASEGDDVLLLLWQGYIADLRAMTISELSQSPAPFPDMPTSASVH
ncbi:tail fiber assembly protein [Citrobacter portucalensis]|uniref:tail fiber assembly protein n=1 Tax=Citrobacter portucalensis TaxID=1639133 RepID=UPI0033398F33